MTTFGLTNEESATVLIQKHYEAMYTLKGQPQQYLLEKARQSALVTINHTIGSLPDTSENNKILIEQKGIKKVLEDEAK